MYKSFLSLGSNIGDRGQNIEFAVCRIFFIFLKKNYLLKNSYHKDMM